MTKEINEKKIMEINILQNELAQLEQQMQLIDRYVQDIQNLQKSLDELKNIKKDHEFFSPLGQEVFIRAKILTPDELLVNIGEKILVKKTVDETKEITEEKLNKVKEIQNQVTQQIEIILNELHSIEHELNPMHKH